MRIILILLFSFVAREAAAAAPLYAWIEMGPKSSVIARAIVSKKYVCPSIKINEGYYPMQLRARADKDFPVHSCEYQIPPTAESAAIGEQVLVLPSKRLEKIVIIGDTGCRLKDTQVQGCNNPKSWPFAEIAEQLSEINPDLVIHVGDYHYRESPCPAWKKSCKGSPSGYQWKAWEADFFKPAEPLLAAAPWIMIRGNHEDCSRAAKGWRRFLDPNTLGATCPDYTAPYAVRMGDQRFVVFDSAVASLFVKPEQVEIYKKQFQTVNALAGKNTSTWLLLHHPIWALYKTTVGPSISNTASLQAAIAETGLSSSIKLIVSGHLHFVGWLHFENRPVQLIAGNSGSKLISHPMNFGAFKGSKLEGQKIEDAFSSGEFGYLLATREAKNWIITAYRINGSVIGKFKVPISP